MKVVAESDDAVVIEFITEDDIWEGVYNKWINYGDELYGKIVIQPHQALLYIYIPKLIRDGKEFKEHLTREKKTIDFDDFLIMNKAIQEINAPLYELLPRL